MGALAEVFLSLKTKVDDRPIDKARKKTEGLNESLGSLIKLAGAAFAGRALLGFTKGLIEAGDELDKTTQQLGVSVAALQEFRFAGERLGAPVVQIDKAFSRLNQRAVEVGQGMMETKRNFDQLGVSVTNQDGSLKTAEQLFLDVAAGAAAIENPTKSSGLLLRLFGDEARSLIPLLRGGREGIEELRKEFRELGGGFSEDVVSQAAEAQDNIARLQATFAGLKSNLAVQFLPIVDRLIQGFTSTVKAIGNVVKNVDLMQLGLVVLSLGAVPLAIKVLANLRKAFLLIGIVAFIAAVDDLITAFRGGKSVLADFVQEFFGLRLAEDILDPLVFTFAAIGRSIQTAWEYLVAFGKAIGSLGAGALSALGFDGFEESAKNLRKSAQDSLKAAQRAQANIGSGAFNDVQYLSRNRAATREATAEAARQERSVNVNMTVNGVTTDEVLRQGAARMSQEFKRSMGDG